MNHTVGKGERYYQEIAVNRAVEGILTGRRRILLTMATGTGKTAVAFQICWKLWSAGWNRTRQHRRPKILYLADRNILQAVVRFTVEVVNPRLGETLLDQAWGTGSFVVEPL